MAFVVGTVDVINVPSGDPVAFLSNRTSSLSYSLSWCILLKLIIRIIIIIKIKIKRRRSEESKKKRIELLLHTMLLLAR